MSPLRFLHLADLHLMPCPSGGRCGAAEPACHRCIKANLLERLAARIESDRPDLLLLAGDLTDVRGDPAQLRAAAAPLMRLIERATRVGVGVVGITGEHDGANSTDNLRRVLGWSWLLHSGETVEYKGVEIHAVEGRANRAGLCEDLMRLKSSSSRSILLAHGEPSAVRMKGAPQFSYCALGHVHRPSVMRLATGRYAAYPGYLFSHWDGDGKAWPCQFVEGKLNESGDVELGLVDSGAALGAPQTRRLYVDYAHRSTEHGTLVFENAPEGLFFESQGLQAELQSQRDTSSRAPFRRVARLPYASRSALKDVVRLTLQAHRSDVFVLPSDDNGWESRADTGSRFAALRLDECLRRIFKVAPNTQ